MRNRSIQRGGAFIVVVDPKTGKRTIIEDPVGNSRILFDNLQTVNCISVESNGSFVFVGEIPQPDPKTLVDIRSQSRSKTKRPLTQREALARPRNIEHGRPLTRVCMKVIFVGKTPSRVDGLYTKEVVTLEMAEQEVQTQHQMYRKLISGGTGVNGAVIPDAFGSCLLTCDEFQSLLPKSKQELGSLVQTKNVLNWILLTARSKGLQLYVSFIEYLEDFESFNEYSELHKLNIPSIGGGAVAILLKTGCVSVDMYYKNIMVHKYSAAVQFIDFGKSVCFTSPEGPANVKTWFKEYSEYCKSDDLQLLDKCFTPTVASAKTVSPANVQLKFNAYCDAVPSRLEHWNTLTTPREKVKEVFDLLTFIGFIDCLYGFSKRRDTGQYIFLMQFGLFMNLLLGRKIGKPFLIDDIIRIRSNFDKRIRQHKNRKIFEKRLTGVVEILSQTLQPDEALGTPRSADSFEYGEDSDVEQEIIVVDEASSPKKSERSRSRTPSRSPSRSPSRGRGRVRVQGGRKPITKKRRRVKRKTRVSRRKY